MEREAVLPYASKILDLLGHACEQAVVAGSVRRGRPDVKDLEIVATLPAQDESRNNLLAGMDLLLAPLGPEPVSVSSSKLDEAIRRGVDSGLLAWQMNVKSGNRSGDGPKYKKLLVPDIGLKVDLFIVDRDAFGNQLAIRTGDGEFSQWMVTSHLYGGGMPLDMAHAEGRLWKFDDMEWGREYRRWKELRDTDSDSHARDVLHECAKPEACPTEQSFFDAIGVPMIKPSDRDSDACARLRAALPHREALFA